MTTHWQSYRGGPTRPPASVVNISISSKKVIALNRQAHSLLGGPESVLLLFDEKNSIIGLIASSIRNAEAFPVRAKNIGNWIINAAPFCRHFNISVESTERFVGPDLDNDGILRLDLKHTYNVSVRRPRAGVDS